MSRILITGGAGFLGVHLTKKLLEEENKVLVIDNFCTGSRRNLLQLLPHPNLNIKYHDVTKPIDVKVDQIYNLACPASPVQYQADPIQTTKTIVQGAINVLDLARKEHCPILQASTSEVYGDPEVHPQSEQYLGRVNPIGIRSCYDEGKRCAESLFFDYHRQYSVNIKVARIFNTYGPGMDISDGRVVSNFIIQALQGNDITVNGDGQQTRSFCFVSDLILGLTKLMETKSNLVGPINIGNPVEHTILELAEQILRLTYSRSKIVFKKLPLDDPKQRCPDITLAQKNIGWQPKTDLEDGLKETIAYFKAKLIQDKPFIQSQ